VGGEYSIKDPVKISISTLFFYKQELSKKFVTSILPSLELHSRSHLTDTIDFIITDNTPEAASILPEVQLIVAKYLKEKVIDPNRVRFQFHRNPHNLGFGRSHNENFKKAASSDIFIVINNDLFISSMGNTSWIHRLCAPFSNAKTAVVGVSSSPRKLTKTGEGRTGSRSFDYAEGSILAVRSKVASQYGLFAQDLEIAYFEDSDLSLRYRQMGYEIDFVDLPHEHQRGSSSELINPDLLEAIRIRNQTRFLARWGRYLKKRSFENKLFLDLSGGGWGDVVAAIPTLTGMLRDHPTTTIEVQTNQTGLAELIAFPRVTVRTKDFENIDHLRNASDRFDRVFSLLDVDYSSVIYLGRQIALDAGVSYDIDLAREAILTRLPPTKNPLVAKLLQSGERICVLHTESLRETWEGRSLDSRFFFDSANLLKSRGYQVVLIGAGDQSSSSKELAKLCTHDFTGKTSLEDIFSLMKNASLFIGMDSGPLHVAQLFNVPSFIVFGATLPTARLLNLDNSYGYVREDLNCIGCYHRIRSSAQNYCIRRDQACVKDLDGKIIAEKLSEFLEGSLKWDFKAIKREQEAVEIKQILWSKSSLPQSTALAKARLRDLLSALATKLYRVVRDRLRIY
jgi:GT2 family glycosyltransferase